MLKVTLQFVNKVWNDAVRGALKGFKRKRSNSEDTGF
jgi:hypothetical protein